MFTAACLWQGQLRRKSLLVGMLIATARIVLAVLCDDLFTRARLDESLGDANRA